MPAAMLRVDYRITNSAFDELSSEFIPEHKTVQVGRRSQAPRQITHEFEELKGSEKTRFLIRELKQQEGRAIWLCGGGDLGTTLLAAGLIDKLILKVNPVLFGSGIPMFRDSRNLTGLTLEGHHAFDSGHLILRYAISSPRSPRRA